MNDALARLVMAARKYDSANIRLGAAARKYENIDKLIIEADDAAEELRNVIMQNDVVATVAWLLDDKGVCHRHVGNDPHCTTCNSFSTIRMAVYDRQDTIHESNARNERDKS